MAKKIYVTVTANDIKAAEAARNLCRTSETCPIAQALRRSYYPQASVGLTTFKVKENGPSRYKLPKKAQQFIDRFDSREKPVTPFRFTTWV